MRKIILIALFLLALMVLVNSEHFSDSAVYSNAEISFSEKEGEEPGKVGVEINEIWFEYVERICFRDRIRIICFRDRIRIFADVESLKKTRGHRLDQCELTVPEAGMESSEMVLFDVLSLYEKTYIRSFPIPNQSIINVTVKCSSHSGHISERTETFNISEYIKEDSEPPETRITPSASELEEWQQGPVKIELECRDDFSGCKKIHYFSAKISEEDKFLEGIKAIESQDAEKLWELLSESTEREKIEFNVNEMTLLAFASEDKAGNIENPKGVVVRVDNKAPVTDYNGPVGVVEDSAEIIFSCNDMPEWDVNAGIELASGCSKTRYKINEESWHSYSGKIRIEESGEYSIGYYSVDNAGNKEEIKKAEFVIKETEEKPLEITSGPNAVASHESVEISWVSNKASEALVRYGKTTELIQEKFSDENAVSHSIEITGLDSKTKYYYKAVSFTEKDSAESEILSFKTLEKPVEEELEIIEVRVQVTDNTAEIEWQTSINAFCELAFWEEGSEEEKTTVSEDEKEHRIKISGLLESTRHGFEIKCRKDFLSSSYAGSFVTRSAETEEEPAEEVEIEPPFRPGSSETERNVKINGEEREPDPPKIRGLRVSPDSRVQDEGRLFTFEVDIFSDLAYEYIWDYGDGTEKEITREPKSEHAYYFEDDDVGMWEKDFLVTVTVRDRQTGKESSIQTTVTVKRAAFKARLIQPRPGELLEKGEEALLKIVFLDIENNIIEPDKIRTFSVSVDRRPLESNFEGNVLEVKYRSGVRTTNQKIVVVEAEAEIGNRTEKIEAFLPIRFKPVEIIPRNPFEGREYYLGSLLRTYRVQLNLKDVLSTKMQQVAGYLESSTYRKRVNTFILPSATALEINHFIEEADAKEGVFLRLEGRDYHGNTLNALLEVPINQKNPDFQIHLVQPIGKGYARGETAEIISKVESEKGLKGELAVECGQSTGKAEYKGAGLYYFSFPVPEDFAESEMQCTVQGQAEDGENLFKDIKQFSFPVYDVSAEFLVPRQGTSSSLLPINSIKIAVEYGDGSPFTAETLKGKININGEESNIIFTGKGNEFTALLDEPLEFGENIIRLSVSEPVRFEAIVYANIAQGLELYQAILILIAGGAVVLIVHRRIKGGVKVKSAREQLDFEKKQLEELLKKIKVEYFKRRISKTEYKERRNAAKARLKKIKKMLK